MSPSHQITPATTERPLAYPRLANEEDKLVKSLIKSKKLVIKLKKDGRFSEWLVFLTIKIAHLDAKLIEVRSRTNSG